MSVNIEAEWGGQRQLTWGKFLERYGTLIFILLVIVFFAVTCPGFLTAANFSDIIRSITITTFIALGVTFSLAVNGFDLSIGSVASFSGALAAGLMVWNRQLTLVAVLVPLVAGLAVGILNALLIVYLRLPDILATLATLFVVQGLQLTYSQGTNIYSNMPMANGTTAPGVILKSFMALSQGSLWHIPIPLFLLVLGAGLAHWFLTYTRAGRNMYAIGGNELAAYLTGIRVKRYKALAYILSGGFAAFGGVLLTARLGAGETLAGSPYLLDAVTATYIGLSVFGIGKPNAIGTLVGAFFLGVILNGATMLNISYTAQDIFKGIVLVVALIFSYTQKTRRLA
nr:ABC transporter permease [Alicyclobacillus contaminans]